MKEQNETIPYLIHKAWERYGQGDYSEAIQVLKRVIEELEKLK